jgi:hypothetical protein
MMRIVYAPEMMTELKKLWQKQVLLPQPLDFFYPSKGSIVAHYTKSSRQAKADLSIMPVCIQWNTETKPSLAL